MVGSDVELNSASNDDKFKGVHRSITEDFTGKTRIWGPSFSSLCVFI